MANIKFVGEVAASRIADYVNQKLTFVSSMPQSPALNTIVMYTGTTTSSYVQGSVYQYNGTVWQQISSVQAIELTQLEYDALSPQAKNNGTIYFVTDAETGIVYGYLNTTDGKFYRENTYTTEIPANSNCIYIDLSTNLIYRYDTTNTEYISVGGSGGSANIVNCTQAEYDALPSSKESDDVLYVVYFDGGQVLDPDYRYYKYGDNDEIIVRVYHERESDQQILWFFNGWNQTSLDMPIPTELQVYKPSDTSPIYSDSYLTVDGAQTSWFGFYNNNFRSWDLSLGGQYTGIVHAVVNPFPSSIGQQINGYYSPYVYIQTSDQIRRIYMNGREYAEFNGGGGDLTAHELTQVEYNALSQAEKESETDVYFINDTVKEEIETPVDITQWQNTAERNMRISTQSGFLVYSWGGGSYIGAFSIYQVQIPADVKKVKYKLTTGTAYSNTTLRFRIGVGVKTFNSTTPSPMPDTAYDNTWIKFVAHDEQNATIEGELDLSDVTDACYLYLTGHGWNVKIDEMVLVTEQETSETVRKIMYKDALYADGAGGESWTDIEGILIAGNTNITLISSDITLDSTLEFFTDVFGVCPTNVSVAVGSVTLTFDEQANDLGVKVRVTNPGAVLPYTFKNYLEVGNTAGAYINTGLNIATTQEFEVKFQLTDTQENNVVYFGCWQSYKDTMAYYYAGGFGCGVGGTMTPRHNFDTDIHVYKAMQDAIYLDDVQDGSANWANAPTNVPYYLFKDPDHSGAINIRIYYAKIWDNGTLIRDFIPAVRNDDGVIGMYDQVNDVFYTNDGTGSFITD